MEGLAACCPISMCIRCIIMVTVVSGSVQITPTSRVINVGRSFTFTCTVNRKGALVIFKYGSVNQCTIHGDGTLIRSESGTNCSRQGVDSTSYFMTTQHAKRVHNRKDWHCQVGADKSNNATLYVLYPPNVTRFTANGRSMNNTVTQGVNVTLQCRVDANPNASITIKKGNSVLQTREGVSMATETLKSVSCRDMATYHCMASNSIGLHSSKVQLFVRCPPSVADPTSNLFFAAIREQVTLDLAVLAFPVPIFTWHGPSGEIIRVNNGTLNSESEFVDSIVISDVSKTDIGDYVVSVQNEVGDGNFTVTLKLKDGLHREIIVGVAAGCVVICFVGIICVCKAIKKTRRANSSRITMRPQRTSKTEVAVDGQSKTILIRSSDVHVTAMDEEKTFHRSDITTSDIDEGAKMTESLGRCQHLSVDICEDNQLQEDSIRGPHLD